MLRLVPAFAFVLLLAVLPATAATTWYVRTDGGPPDRCDGKADAAAPAAGSGLPCAWDHPFRALPPGGTPRIGPGDTLVIGPGSYRMGFGAPGAEACEDPGTWDCHLLPLPSGPSASQPTRLVGAGADSGCPSPPELWGTQRANWIVDLTRSSNVEVACLVLTDHSGCAEGHTGGLACERDTSPYGDWAAMGLHAEDSANVRLRDLDVHGLASTGIHAGRLTNWTVERVRIAANGSAGWDGDIDGPDSNSGAMTFRDFTVEWNGCPESYPAKQPAGCWAQSAGGYGDGLGTGETEGAWLFEDSAFLHNTSDGLDLLYARGSSTITITRTRAEGNAGNQLKTNGPAVIENSIAVGNCGFFRGKPFTYDVDDCRALGNTISLSLRPGNRVRLTNDTVTGQGDCLVVAGCFGGGACVGTELVTMRNGIYLGEVEHLVPDDRACFFYQEEFPQGQALFDADYQLVRGVKDDACPGAHALCGVDPGLVNASITAFDAHLLATSPAIGFASKADAPGVDFDDLARDAAPDIGAYEYRSPGACTVACSATVQGSAPAGSPVAFSATAQASGCPSAPAYDWDFGDGTPHGSQATLTHLFAAPGIYSWHLTVSSGTTTCSRTGDLLVTGAPPAAFLVPSVVHSPGVAGSLWRTDLVAVNRASAAASLTLTFVPPAGPTLTRSSSVGARGTRAWSDVLTSLFGYAGDASVSGALHVVADQAVAVSSRTFNQAAAGTFGGYLGAVTATTALSHGSTGILPQLRKGGGFRTNVGIANLESGSVTVAIRLVDGTGTRLGQEVTVTVQPAGFVQVTDVFAAAGAGDTALAYAELEVRTPGGKVGAFASVIDNATNDPTIVPLAIP